MPNDFSLNENFLQILAATEKALLSNHNLSSLVSAYFEYHDLEPSSDAINMIERLDNELRKKIEVSSGVNPIGSGVSIAPSLFENKLLNILVDAHKIDGIVDVFSEMKDEYLISDTYAEKHNRASTFEKISTMERFFTSCKVTLGRSA